MKRVRISIASEDGSAPASLDTTVNHRREIWDWLERSLSDDPSLVPYQLPGLGDAARDLVARVRGRFGG